MGTPEFAVVSLNKLIKEDLDIVGVVSVPDKPQGRGLKLKPSPVKKAASDAGLQILQPSDLKDPDFLQQIKGLKPDLIVVVAFRILPGGVFTIPPLGTINLHGSLLPKYRGAAPINWAIINGENETGVTTFFIRKKVDTGNIIDSEKIPITPDMTAGELHDIMANVGADLLDNTVRKIREGRVETRIQNESLSTKAPKINRSDCVINFNQPVQNVHNFIRGLSPYPTAHTFLNNKMIKFYKSKIRDEIKKKTEVGKIMKSVDEKEIFAQCNPGIISISVVQLEGKKRMGVEEFLRGINNLQNKYF